MYMNKYIQDARGFTLVEMAIVLIIVGSILGAVSQQLRQYYVNKDFYQTQESLQETFDGLNDYYGNFGGELYPCPADPTLGPADANYGVSVCESVVTMPTCPNNTENVLCLEGGRDANGDGVDPAGPLASNNDYVLIGALPFRSLGDNVLYADFTVADGFDAWGMQYTYAVTAALTNHLTESSSNPARARFGSITVVDEFDNSMTRPADSAHYIVVSHGPNMVGAYSRFGNQDPNCIVTSTTLPIAIGNLFGGTSGIEVDKENCDFNDVKFVDALQSYGDNDNYFDDLVIYQSNRNSTLWRMSAIDFSSNGQYYLYNTNTGNVGVDTDTPGQKLDVNGDIRADSSLIADDSGVLGTETVAQTEGFCSQMGDGCVRPEFIAAGLGKTCTGGQVAVAISGNDIVCVDLFPSGPGNELNITACPTGQFITGISNLGNRTCAP